MKNLVANKSLVGLIVVGLVILAGVFGAAGMVDPGSAGARMALFTGMAVAAYMIAIGAGKLADNWE